MGGSHSFTDLVQLVYSFSSGPEGTALDVAALVKCTAPNWRSCRPPLKHPPVRIGSGATAGSHWVFFDSRRRVLSIDDKLDVPVDQDNVLMFDKEDSPDKMPVLVN